jgi:hypothetical protein
MNDAQVPSQDALDALAFQLYGRKAMAREFIGGSDATILRDAANALRTHNDSAVESMKLRDQWMRKYDEEHAELTAAEAHLATIRSYVEEAAKTPISRESILAAPQVDDAMPPDDLKELYELSKRAKLAGREMVYCGLIERIAKLEAALKAQTMTALTLRDESTGLYRLVLSETGGER